MQQGKQQDMDEKPRALVTPAALCKTCAGKLVRAARFKQTDPWRALCIIGQIAMFQAATTKASVWRRLAGDIERIGELGCLACRLPMSFRAVIKAARGEDPGAAIKALGESWVRA